LANLNRLRDSHKRAISTRAPTAQAVKHTLTYFLGHFQGD